MCLASRLQALGDTVMAEADDDPILEPRPARPWYVQAIDTLNKRSSSLSHAEPNFPKEKSLDDSRLGQMATYERELLTEQRSNGGQAGPNARL